MTDIVGELHVERYSSGKLKANVSEGSAASEAYLEVTLCGHATGVHHSFWLSLSVELSNLLNQLKIFQKNGSCKPQGSQ